MILLKENKGLRREGEVEKVAAAFFLFLPSLPFPIYQ